MADGLEEDASAAGKATLSYPFDRVQSGQVTTVAPGVQWLRMPLPYALDHINLWIIDDGEGWAIVDTGTRTEEVGNIWCELFDQSVGSRTVSRVFVTHMHPDHVGMAGWLTRRFGARLWMSRLEYLNCRVVVSDSGREAPPDGTEFYRRAGWSEAALETYRVRFGNFGKHIHALPDSYRRLLDGETLRIGAHDWRVIVGGGHSPEHVCLHCPALKLLISGDQVLPRISSNVSVYPLEPDADPMSEWLASLDKLRARVPDDVLVLPSHNEPFLGLHARLKMLSHGQERALDRLRRRLIEPQRAIDVFGALFARPISETDVGMLGMATGESIACLNHLVHRGEALREADSQGVLWYRMGPKQ